MSIPVIFGLACCVAIFWAGGAALLALLFDWSAEVPLTVFVVAFMAATWILLEFCGDRPDVLYFDK